MAYSPNDVISTYSGTGPAGSGLDPWLASIPSQRATFNAGQKAEEQGYLGRLTGAIQGQEVLPHMYDRIGRELGMPTLRANALQLNQSLQNIPYTYSGAARGFDVNANQLDRIVSSKSAGLAPAVASANAAVANADQVMGQRIGFEQENQKKQLLPYQTEGQMLSDRFAREATGYGQDKEAELNSYLAKMNGGIQLSQGEQNRANALAIAKLSYDAEIYKANKSYDASKIAGMGNFWS